MLIKAPQQETQKIEEFMAGKLNIKELSRRYTTAVFELAKSEKKLSKLEKDLAEIEAIVRDSKELQRLINSPLISTNEQIAVLKEICKKAGFDSLTMNFLLVVARNRRLEFLPQIVASFRSRIQEEAGQVKAEVISAEKLGAAEIKKIEKEISAKTKKDIQLIEKIDPEIIGGLIIKLGSKMYDYSVRSRLSRMAKDMRSA